MASKKQKLILSFALLSLFLFPMGSSQAEGDIASIRQLANQIYRSAQDMVEHGAEGHVGEIVLYGKKVLKRGELLLEKVEKSTEKKLSEKRDKLLDSIKAMLEKAKEAVIKGENHEKVLSLKAARRTAFNAKKTRQQLQMIR